MRVTIVHNPGSGEKAVTGPDLIAAARAAGHDVTYVSTEDEAAVAERLADARDLVAVVGGDGTMRNVATRLIGRDTPITLIPTGTANNIGRTLGIAGTPRELIAGWAGGSLVAFDTGVVRGASGPFPFIEGVGFGPVAVTIAALSSLDDAEARSDRPDDQVRRDVKVLREVLADYPLHGCRIALDGRDLSGDYLLVEAMNIRSVGPNVELAPAAAVSDGLLDLVLIGEDNRAALRDYLTARLEGARPVLRVPAHRGRHVQVTWKGSRLHIDDKVWPDEQNAASGQSWSQDGHIAIEALVNEASLRVLVPARG